MTEPIKILLVDDIAENLVALEALLRRDGLELLQARSGAEALELLLVHEVSLALLDVQMPEMDGFELAELMRGSERTKRVPIIFVTAGNRDPKRVFKGYESGGVDFLFKPIEPHILRSKVDVFFELARGKQEIARVLKLNETFVGVVGHDLRNPLSAMLVGTELLLEQATDDRTRGVLRRMSLAGKRMGMMIEQLLDLTRARLGGGLDFLRTRVPLDVRAIVQRAVDELRVVHPHRDIVIEPLGSTEAFGDPERQVQLFSNLVGNALVHGSKTERVAVTLDGRGGDIVATVANAGTIAPELLPTIFEPFRGTKRAAGAAGLGLGLYISREIALAHGGDIAVVSTAEAGTRFTVRLPREV